MQRIINIATDFKPRTVEGLRFSALMHEAGGHIGEYWCKAETLEEATADATERTTSNVAVPTESRMALRTFRHTRLSLMESKKSRPSHVKPSILALKAAPPPDFDTVASMNPRASSSSMWYLFAASLAHVSSSES